MKMNNDVWHDPKIDKVAWGSGEWNDEPDMVKWIDPVTQLLCVIARHPKTGHWNGYVVVKKNHPCYGLNEEDELLSKVRVHGGLTYSGKFPSEGMDRPMPTEDWCFGFDCAHFQDYCPGLEAELNSLIPDRGPRFPPATYKSMSFAKAQCEFLANDIKWIQPKSLWTRLMQWWNNWTN